MHEGTFRQYKQRLKTRNQLLETYAEDLKEILDQLEIEKIYLNSHSTGASIGLLFANRYPERVEKLILTCSGAYDYNKVAFELFTSSAVLSLALDPPGW